MPIKLAKPASKLQSKEPAGPKASGTKTTPLSTPGSKVPRQKKKAGKPSKPAPTGDASMEIAALASESFAGLESGDKLLTVAGAAKLTGFAKITVYRWINSGYLPAHRLGRQYRILKSDLLKLLTLTYQ